MQKTGASAPVPPSLTACALRLRGLRCGIRRRRLQGLRLRARGLSDRGLRLECRRHGVGDERFRLAFGGLLHGRLGRSGIGFGPFRLGGLPALRRIVGLRRIGVVGCGRLGLVPVAVALLAVALFALVACSGAEDKRNEGKGGAKDSAMAAMAAMPGMTTSTDTTHAPEDAKEKSRGAIPAALTLTAAQVAHGKIAWEPATVWTTTASGKVPASICIGARRSAAAAPRSQFPPSPCPAKIPP